jgi:phosphate transport system substrate-binding protein
MFRHFFAAILALTFSLPAHAEGSLPIVRINGSTSVANSIVLPHQADIEKAAGVRLVVAPNSSGNGMTDLFGGTTDIAMISSDLDELLGKLSALVQAYKVDKARLRSFDLGEARVEFIVNLANPVRKLTSEQVKAIYLGKLTNWKDVGGPDVRIDAFAESAGGAMRAMLEHEWLGGQKISEFIAETDRAPQVAGMVAKAPHGIGFVSSTTPQALRMGTVPVETDTQLVQHLSLVTKGDPGPDAAKVIDAIKHAQ